MEKPQKQLMWKVLGVALLLLENICPISLPEADNNAKPYWKIRSLLNRLGFVLRLRGEGSSYCPSNKFPKVLHSQPPASPRLQELGALRRRVRKARGQVHSSPTLSQVPGAGQPLLTGARKKKLSLGKEGLEKSREPPSSPRGRKFLLTQTLRTLLGPRLAAAKQRWRRGSRAGKGGEGGGDYSQPSAQGEEWSTSRAPEVQLGEEGGVCGGQKEGEARRIRREGEGGERGQCTWSQPPSLPSPLPGSPRLHRTPWLPGPTLPCAQPLQKQPLPALRTPRLRLLRAVRMLLPQLAPPRLARLSVCELRLLPAAMTAPRASGRGVRVRERAGRRGRRARAKAGATGGGCWVGTRGEPPGRGPAGAPACWQDRG